MVESAVTGEIRRKILGWQYPQSPGERADMWAIRKYTEALADDNPLWHDQRYARKTRWRGVVAPPTFVEVFNPIYQSNRRRTRVSIPLVFAREFLANEEYEFFLPIRPGDIITSSGSIGDVYEKVGSSGRLVFVQSDKEYRNQRGELVARTHWTNVGVEGLPQKPSSEAKQDQPHPEQTRTPAELGARQICFEDFEVDFQLQPLVKHIDYLTFARWVGATSDYARVHLDYPHAVKELDLPGPVLYGQFSSGSMCHLLTGWIGAWGILKRHYVEHRGNVLPGDTISYRAKVTKKYRQDPENLVECQTWAENQEGRIIIRGRSIVALPLRSQLPKSAR